MPLASLALVAAASGPELVLARSLDNANLGTFVMAANILNLPFLFLLGAAAPVLLPALANQKRLCGRPGLGSWLPLAGLGVVLANLPFLLFGGPLFVLVFGPRWQPVELFILPLGLHALLRGCSYLLTVHFFGWNRPGLESRVVVWEVPLYLASLALASAHHDLAGTLFRSTPALVLGLLARLWLAIRELKSAGGRL